MDDIQVLWLRPDTGTNVSTRRTRIAEHLNEGNIHIRFKTIGPRDLPTATFRLVVEEYDVVISNVRLPMYMSYPFTAFSKTPFIGDVSDPISQISDLPSPLYWALERYEWWILRHTDVAFFAESQSYKAAVERGVNAVLAKNAVNFRMFAEPNTSAIESARRTLLEMGVDLNEPVALYPGRFLEIYHTENMLETALLSDDWQFVFIGEGGKQHLVEQAAASETNVFYPGSVAHEFVPGFYHFADVGLCLVNAERPLKILEFGAARVPVLGIPGQLQEEFSEREMWFTKPSPDDIVSALDRIRSNPEAVSERVNALSKKAAENSWREIAEQYRIAILHAVESD